ncbi:unnamed protein product [Symbiodinium sp. CCMP2592]|nr:unnamed protein product [Symbiodinium sp. CCMP2592]CAE7317825.1 unnamed protein product [Symbiodinium sp. CCMP2592]
MGNLTLDIPEVQVLVNFPGDANGLNWHHRILLHRVAGAEWIALTPDYDLERHSLGAIRHRVLDRRAPFPDDIAAEVYAHDPVGRAQLSVYKRRAQLMASVLGDGAVEELDTVLWVIADPTHRNFGTEIDAGLLDNEATGVAFASKGVAIVDGEEVFVERVHSSGLAAWKAARGDVRLLGDHKDGAGKRKLDLAKAVALMRSPKDDEFPIAGVRAAKELHESISEGPGNFLSYHAEWLRLSGVSSRNAASHVHRNLCDVLRLMHSYDQLDCSALACGETLCRWMIQTELAVERSPAQPDYTGLDIVAGTATLPDGRATTTRFSEWVSGRMKDRAAIWKQERLFKAERKGRGRGYDRENEDTSDEESPNGKGRKKKKKKNEEKADKDSPGSSGAGAKDRKHGEPFPLPRLSKWRSVGSDPVQALKRRVDGAFKVLNDLASAPFDTAPCSLPLTQSQTWMMNDVMRRVAAFGEPPPGIDEETAIRDLAAKANLYMEEAAHLADCDMDKIKVLHRRRPVLPAHGLLPPHARVYLDHFAELIEKSPGELEMEAETSDPIEPYWDPRLRNDKALRLKFYHALQDAGLLTFRRRRKARVGFFVVRKKDGMQRLIVDARQSNQRHRRPPTTAWLRQLGWSMSTSGTLLARAADQSVKPVSLQWLPVDNIFDDATQKYITPADDEPLFFAFRGMCMGWSWALYLANEIVVHQTALGGSLEEDRFIRDKKPPPRVGASEPGVGVYVDNVNIIGLGQQPVNDVMDAVADRFAGLGIPFEVTDKAGDPVIESLGLEFNFEGGGMVVRDTRKRAWRLWLATKALARRQRVSGEVLRVWLGHVNFYFQLNRSCVSVISACYRFAALHLGRRGHVWPNVRKELRQVMGLIFLVEVDMAAPRVSTVHVGDASMYGFFLMKTEATREEIDRELRVREHWRFIPGRLVHKVPAVQDGPIRQDFYGRQLREDLDLVAGRPLERRRKQLFGPAKIAEPTLLEANLHPPVHDCWHDSRRWGLIQAAPWRDPAEHINPKEARVCVMGLRRWARSSSNLGKVVFTLSDSLVSVLALEKGRSTSASLNRQGGAAGDEGFEKRRGGPEPDSGFKGRFAWELFSGTGNLTKAIDRAGLPCLQPLDVCRAPHHDLTHPAVQRIVLDVLLSGLVWYVHMGTPCVVWSRARHNIQNHKKARAKERVGIQLAAFSARIAWLCLDLGVGFSIENPRSSLLWSFAPILQLLGDSRVSFVTYDSCQYGACCKKPTALLTNLQSLSSLSQHCDRSHRHEVLRRSWRVKREGRWITEARTASAGAYTVALASAWAKALKKSGPQVSRDDCEDPVQAEQVERLLQGERDPLVPRGPAGCGVVCDADVDSLRAEGIVFGQHNKKEAAVLTGGPFKARKPKVDLSGKELPVGLRLRAAKVSQKTLDSYLMQSASFEKWARERKAKVNKNNLDKHVVKYLTWLFEHEDSEPWTAAYLVYGLQLLRCDIPKHLFLPNAKEALAGWRKQRPGSMRLPVPEEFVYDVVLFLAQQHLQLALLVLLQLDGYLRPSEALGLTQDPLVPPAGARYPRWGIVVALEKLGERTKAPQTTASS